VRQMSLSLRASLRRIATALSVGALMLLTLQISRPAGGPAALLAPTPPMGWNSWDSYGTTVREDQVRANADYMASHLAGFGWKYVVVDIQWYEANAQGHDYKPGTPLTMDAYGRLTPALNRFPSAANGAGFKPLAGYIHGKGLKFGIHIMRGIPRQAVDQNLPVKGTSYRAAAIADKDNGCVWNPDMWGVDTTKPGAQAYYDSIAELYASWGVDFIKVDDMGSHLYQPAEIKALAEALRKTGRPIVLSISPGPAPLSEARFFQKYAQMWRISDDFWDDWKLLERQFDYTREWAPEVGKNGTWPDADMLPIGRLRMPYGDKNGEPSKFTHDEQLTMINLFSIFRSPLIMGGDLPTLDTFTLGLLTNSEVLAVDQASTGGHQSSNDGATITWIANVPGGSDKYVAVFNLKNSPNPVQMNWKTAGVDAAPAHVRDLWQHKNLGTATRLEVTLAPHASVLYRVGQSDAKVTPK
jgi:alpha-galactosidase